MGCLRNNETFKNTLSLSLKKKVYNQCVMPMIIYGSGNLTFIKADANRLRIIQHKIEMSVLEIKLLDREKKNNQHRTPLEQIQ